jgi:AP-2 complex subunit beta-1
MLANEYNLGDMLNELNEYANDVDVEIAVKSVHVLADIALRLPDVSKALMINLISFYNTEQEHLVNSSIVCFYRLLRKYPKLFSEIKQQFL